jgi:hypothetical protein
VFEEGVGYAINLNFTGYGLNAVNRTYSRIRGVALKTEVSQCILSDRLEETACFLLLSCFFTL